MNYYEILEIAKTATPDEIKRAYRKLASKHHPDKGGDTSKFQQIEEAYRILSDPQQRAQYDNPPQQNNFRFDFGGQNAGMNLDDIFQQFGFQFGGHPFQQHRAPRNHDLRTQLVLSLQDTQRDQIKTLSIRHTNGTRHTVDVRIPRGITSGTTIQFGGLGDAVVNNAPPGNLLVEVVVNDHPKFTRSGLDITTRLTLDVWDAIIGSEQTVHGINGEQYVIKTPFGCQPGQKLKISGEGLWGFQNDIKGHLFVQVDVVIPKNMNDRQIELIRQIKQQTN